MSKTLSPSTHYKVCQKFASFSAGDNIDGQKVYEYAICKHFTKTISRVKLHELTVRCTYTSRLSCQGVAACVENLLVALSERYRPSLAAFAAWRVDCSQSLEILKLISRSVVNFFFIFWWWGRHPEYRHTQRKRLPD